MLILNEGIFGLSCFASNHVHNKQGESRLPSAFMEKYCFSRQKLGEVEWLAEGSLEGIEMART